MTDKQHPITIPPDLEEELLGLWPQEALQRAAQWGAEQELDACCEWIANNSLHHAESDLLNDLRAARRPKLKRRKQRALDALAQMEDQYLSAELAQQLDDALDFTVSGGTRRYMKELVGRALTAVAEPKPEEPTDEELLELTDDWPATTGPRHDLSGCPDVPLYSVFADEVIEFARAVLARWGRPSPVPVPVSERLPGPEDCDAEGRCWLHGKVEGDWRLINVANPGVPKLSYCFSHWLPAYALPLPNNTSRSN